MYYNFTKKTHHILVTNW